MTFLPSLRTSTFCTTVCTAVIVGGALVNIQAAKTIPISGVKPSVTVRAEAGPRLEGPFPKTAGVSSGSSLAKGPPKVLPAPANSSDWLLGMKR
jgi:hypothetical protein